MRGMCEVIREIDCVVGDSLGDGWLALGPVQAICFLCSRFKVRSGMVGGSDELGALRVPVCLRFFFEKLLFCFISSRGPFVYFEL